MLKFECPECKKTIELRRALYSMEDVEGATLDCTNPECEALLIIDGGKTHNFHKWMHRKDPNWPEDGEGTGVVDV